MPAAAGVRPDTRELIAAQIPALMLLQNLGYTYLNPDQAMALRSGKAGELLLREVLVEELRGRQFSWKGREYKLSANAVAEIVRKLASPSMVNGLIPAAEAIHTHLTLGVTVTEFVDGQTAQVTIPLIDWHQPENNRLHVTDEYVVQDSGGTGHRIPDIVCFVNGIPLAVIEAKCPAPHHPGKDMLAEAISQQLRNQRNEEVPKLYTYSQALLAVDGLDGRYGTTGTPRKFWSLWREELITDAEIAGYKNAALSAEQHAAQFDHREGWIRSHFAKLIAGGERQVSGQDRLIVSLLRPDRLLDLTRRFVMFDRKHGKRMARYQQYFGVQELIRRVQQPTIGGGREGGVIWHTTGSGKSLTMVLLAQAMILEPALKQCRFVVVTDRVDLEDQLLRVFANAGALGSADVEAAKARSGADLAERIGSGQDRILFSIINKFQVAARSPKCRNDSRDLIVLIDEGHRSQGGETHARMRRALPNAAFVAFTGTPLLREHKTARQFGGIVHAYPMQQAVEDRAVAPLLYEERRTELVTNAEAVDAWFERITEGLTEEQRADLKKKYARAGAVQGAEGRIELIAYDLSDHFARSIPPGMKGQLATDSKRSALRYKKALDAIGVVSSAVVISPPDSREGHDSADDSALPEIQRWWRDHVGGRGEKAYTKDVLTRFAQAEDPQILIVVDKLLTGFDEPRNMVLYIDKPLKQHNLIQAIARVNRLHEQKDYGLLIDYRGILSQLDMTIEAYRELQQSMVDGFDVEDLAGLYAQASSEYRKLPHLHKALWSFFTDVKNRGDIEAYRQVLMPQEAIDENGDKYDPREKLRDDFFRTLREFTRCLEVALGSAGLYQDTAFSEADIERYKQDLAWFQRLRTIALRDADKEVDYSEYEARIQKLIDKHVHGVQVIDPDAIYRLDGDGSRVEHGIADAPDWSENKWRNEADLIRARIKRTIDERLGDDPYAKKRFSELLNEAIEQASAMFDHPQGVFELFTALDDRVKERDLPELPDDLKGQGHAAAYYGVFRLVLDAEFPADPAARRPLIDLALEIDRQVTALSGEHSVNPQDLEKAIRNQLLPPLFRQFGMDAAKLIVEHVVHIVRHGLLDDTE